MSELIDPWSKGELDSLVAPTTHDQLIEQGCDMSAVSLLSLNESPLPPSVCTQDSVADIVADVNRYPGNFLQGLVDAVAARTGMAADRQVWAAGANDLIYRCLSICAQASKDFVLSHPNYWGYERAIKLTRVGASRVPIHADGRTDVRALIGAVNNRTGIVAVTTPGNPSGLSVSEEELAEVARRTPQSALLVIDEVYHEFAHHAGGPDVLKVLNEHRDGPWLVLRSFSKAYCMAGARVGFALASHPELATRIQSHAMNFCVSSLGFKLAYAAWCDTDGLARYLDANAANREILRDALRKLGLSPMESHTNFVSVPMPLAAADILPHLRDHNVYCAGWNTPAFANFLRIGIGADQDIERLIPALKTVLKKA